VGLGVLVAPLHERPDRGRGGVELGDAVALDDLPEAVLGRVVGHALVHHRGGPVGQRPVDDVAVPGDPADVGRAPVDVGVGLEVEHVAVGEGDLGEVAAGGVHDALGLAGGARGVEQVEQVLAVHRLARAVGLLAVHGLVPPQVAALIHLDVVLAALDDQHVLDRGGVGQRLVRVGLERRDLAAPVAAVGGDQHLRLGVVDAVAQRRGGEATEHHRVRGADPCAGEHDRRQLGDHRQVDRHAVALGDAQLLERVGGPLDVLEQPRVGDGAGVAGLALPVEGHLLAVAVGHMPVEAVVGHVELAVDEPPGVGRVPVEDGGPLLEPVELGGLAGPEALAIRGGLVVDLRAGDQRLTLEALGRRERAPLVEQALDRVACHLRPPWHGSPLSPPHASARHRLPQSTRGHAP
jgi:hypothetical protein